MIYTFWTKQAEWLTFKYSHNAIAILEAQMKPQLYSDILWFFKNKYIYILIQIASF